TVRGEALRTTEPVEDRRAELVDPLHLGEVLRRLGLTREHRADELVLVLDLERPVVEALVAHRAVRDRAQPLPARAPRAVAWPDLEPIGLALERLQRPEQTPGAGLRRALHPGRLLEEVRAPDVADEDEVAGQRRDRTVRDGAVRDQEHQVLRRVAGRVDRLDPDVADVE